MPRVRRLHMASSFKVLVLSCLVAAATAGGHGKAKHPAALEEALRLEHDVSDGLTHDKRHLE